MKSIRKSNLFTTIVVMLFTFSIIGFAGCEKESLFNNNLSDCLDLESYDFHQMSSKDMKSLSEALKRLDINKINGIYEIKQTSGSQINLSEKLFEFITEGFKHTNSIIQRKAHNNQIPRLKTRSNEGDPEGDPQSTDCVAYSIAGMGDFSYTDVMAYCDSLGYTNGVPLTEMDAVFSHYYPGGSSTLELSNGAMESNMFYYTTAEGDYHAVNGIFYDENTQIIMCYDPQNFRYDFIHISEVGNVYFSNKP